MFTLIQYTFIPVKINKRVRHTEGREKERNNPKNLQCHDMTHPHHSRLKNRRWS